MNCWVSARVQKTCDIFCFHPGTDELLEDGLEDRTTAYTNEDQHLFHWLSVTYYASLDL